MADIWIKVLQPADSYALLTLDELKIILNLAPTDTSEDAQLNMWIDQYSDVVATMCNRVFAYETVEETWRGDLPPFDGPRLFLTHYPVADDDITSVESPRDRRGRAEVLGVVKPHLMVTDPPYGVDYDPTWRATAGVNQNKRRLGKVANDDIADWRPAWRLFPGSVAYVWHAGRYASTVQDSLAACGFEVRSQITWAKDRFALSRGHYHWQHEPCFYSVRGNSANWTGDRSQSTLWQIPSREGQGLTHGTQKPVECMKRPIENNSSPGQAVYEPFSGSGTTIIAAEMTGRSCHAIELLPQYVDVAIERWQQFTGEQAVLDFDGDARNFQTIAEGRRAAAGSTARAADHISPTPLCRSRWRRWPPTAFRRPRSPASSRSIRRRCASIIRTSLNSVTSRRTRRSPVSYSTRQRTAT